MKRSVDDRDRKLPPVAEIKPVLMSKAERQRLALQRREEEVAEQRRRTQELLNNEIQRPSSDSKPDHHSSAPDSNHRHRDQDRDREEEARSRERDRDRDRDHDCDRRACDRDRDRDREEEARCHERARLEKLAERGREKKLESIKKQYPGSKKPKKRVIKPSEKFRFSFDWENTEDTSRDMNTLYRNPHEARLLFGRGFLADRRKQKKLAARHEKETRQEIRRKEGLKERPEEAAAQRQMEAAADLYDAFDMRVDRHWTEKKLEEMTERDWRIFREDFNISYKGSRIPRPMRSWADLSALSS